MNWKRVFKLLGRKTALLKTRNLWPYLINSDSMVIKLSRRSAISSDIIPVILEQILHDMWFYYHFSSSIHNYRINVWFIDPFIAGWNKKMEPKTLLRGKWLWLLITDIAVSHAGINSNFKMGVRPGVQTELKINRTQSVGLLFDRFVNRT